MKHVILVRYGEISLKGLNRNYFIDLLARNIRSALSRLESVKVRKVQGRIIVDIDDSDMQEGLERIVRVFGIVPVSPAAVIESRLEVIEQTVEDLVKPLDFRTFRVSARRADNALGPQQRAARRLAQAGVAVFANAHHCQPGRHAALLAVTRGLGPAPEKAGIIAPSSVPGPSRGANGPKREHG